MIEERLQGYEISLLVVSDGQSIRPLPAARDHKRQLDGDQGPNTGGMGAVAPVLDPQDPLHETLMSIMQSVVNGMAQEGQPYVGILYGGFMITPMGPKVLEFNCRFGDPETQAVLALLGDEDLFELITAASRGELASVHCQTPVNMQPPWSWHRADIRERMKKVCPSRASPKLSPMKGFLCFMRALHSQTRNCSRAVDVCWE